MKNFFGVSQKKLNFRGGGVHEKPIYRGTGRWVA